jgi:FkbM family methyltransferase
MSPYKNKLFLFSVIVSLILFFCFSRFERKYVFIDAGAHFGEQLKAFKTTKLYKSFPWKIYAIEADRNFINKIPKGRDIVVINKAVWIYDGTLDFYLAVPGETTSSVYKKEGFNKKKVTVECFDFGRWLKDNFSKKDYIILSVDMAGSEYKVLEKMISDGSIEYVDRLYVEFSQEFVPEVYAGERDPEDVSYEREYSIIRKVRELNIIFDGDSVEDVINERGTWKDEL